MTPKDLRRAAKLLLDWARVLKDSGSVGGRWESASADEDRAEYDEHMRLSRALYKEARKP